MIRDRDQLWAEAFDATSASREGRRGSRSTARTMVREDGVPALLQASRRTAESVVTIRVVPGELPVHACASCGATSADRRVTRSEASQRHLIPNFQFEISPGRRTFFSCA
jgi:hypothetical protein